MNMLEWWDKIVDKLDQPCKYDEPCKYEHYDEPTEEFMLHYIPESRAKQHTYLSENPNDSIEVEYESEGTSSPGNMVSVMYRCPTGLDFSRNEKNALDQSQQGMDLGKKCSDQNTDGDPCPLLSLTSDIDEEEVKSVTSEVESETYSHVLSIENDDYIVTSPPILSHEQIIDIQVRALPTRLKMKTWSRLYSLNRDGCYFETMINCTKGWKETLIVMKTDRGDILGGFVDCGWFKQKNIGFFLSKSWKFYGGGEAFVFCQNSSTDQSNEEFNFNLDNIDPQDKNTIKQKLRIYPWTTKNDFIQACDLRTGRIGMGGGHEFAWIVQDNFSVGMTGASATFDNPPLVNDIDGRFNIVDFEVYGFRSRHSISCVSTCI